jgi:predicted NBD/HSP70 family sugar kinase
MKKYIEAHDDAEKTNMTIFYSLRGLDADGNEIELARVSTYGELKMWFLDTYPEVEDMNKTVDDILAKAKKNREAKREAAKKAA